MPKKPTLVYRDPTALKVHPYNVRRDLGDLRPMIRSVREKGVLVPLLIVPDDDGEMVVFGHRRQQSAIAAERAEVPCILRHDLEGDAEQIAAMVIENIHRAPLNAAEEAAAYEQLSVLGLSDTAIARQTGTTKQHVTKARTVAASEVASTVADRYHLTLDQALVLAEFEDDRDAVKALVVAARQNPGQFPHIASRLCQDRDAVRAHTAAVEALQEAGVTVVDRRGAAGAVSLRDLTDGDDGSPITAEAHGACPGHAAYVPTHQPDQPDWYCLDPDGNGHRDRYKTTGGPTPTPMSDEAKAERREVIENNKAWRAAEPVRLDFIRALLARRTAPKGTLRFATVAIVSNPDRVGDGKDDLLADLLGAEAGDGYGRSVGKTHLAATSDARLPLALLAQVAADIERTTDVHSWRRPSEEVARWFAFLAGVGYTLSDVEQHVVDSVEGQGSAAA